LETVVVIYLFSIGHISLLVVYMGVIRCVFFVS
jgi:hypothetical protein